MDVYNGFLSTRLRHWALAEINQNKAFRSSTGKWAWLPRCGSGWEDGFCGCILTLWPPLDSQVTAAGACWAWHACGIQRHWPLGRFVCRPHLVPASPSTAAVAGRKPRELARVSLRKCLQLITKGKAGGRGVAARMNEQRALAFLGNLITSRPRSVPPSSESSPSMKFCLENALCTFNLIHTGERSELEV